MLWTCRVDVESAIEKFVAGDMQETRQPCALPVTTSLCAEEGIISGVYDILKTRVYLGNYSEAFVVKAGLRGAFGLLRSSLEDGGASSMGREILESAKMSLQVLIQLKVLIVASCNISRASSKGICRIRRRLHDVPGF